MVARNDDLVTVLSDADGTVTVRVDGEFDLASAPQFVKDMDALIARRPHLVELHLDGLSFIDSSGLHALVITSRALDAIDGRLELVSVPSSARKVLDVTQVDQVLNIRD